MGDRIRVTKPFLRSVNKALLDILLCVQQKYNAIIHVIKKHLSVTFKKSKERSKINFNNIFHSSKLIEHFISMHVNKNINKLFYTFFCIKSLKTGIHLLYISDQLGIFHVFNSLRYLIPTLECPGLVRLLKVR